jgi:hypothetical protein
LGVGFNGDVMVLTVFDDNLIAAGNFTMTGDTFVNRIARWNGQTWEALGAGVDGTVVTLAVYAGGLVAGGFFTHAGGVDAAHLATWNGSSWISLDSGTDGPVFATAVFHDELVAGGRFAVAGGIAARDIAKWNGNAWSSLGTGINGDVNALVAATDRLFVGGSFTAAGGLSAMNIATWDGSDWHGLGSGVNGPVYTGTQIGGRFIVGGGFGLAGGKLASGIAEWNLAKVPVAVDDFRSAMGDPGLILFWRIPSDAVGALTGVALQRAQERSGPYSTLTSTDLVPQSEMSYEDTTVPEGNSLWYRLLLRTTAGTREVAGPFEVSLLGRAPASMLDVTGRTDAGDVRILYRVSGALAGVTIEIFDIAGRQLQSFRPSASAEWTETIWNRCDSAGVRVSRGLYFVRMATQSGAVVKRCWLVR